MDTLPLDHLRILRFAGRDAARFLHAQLSADIEGLAPGAATFACLCQPKGRVIALLLVWRRADDLLVLCARSLAERVVEHLRRYVFRDDVQIEAPATLAARGHREAVRDGANPLEALAYTISEHPEGAGAEIDAQAAEDFRAHELALGVAWLDEASSEVFLPQMMGAGAIGALNYRKGCYPGQEVVARTHYLGRLKQRPVLARLEAEEAPAVLDSVQISAGEEATAQGRVLDRARRVGGGWQLLLVVRAMEPFESSCLGWDDQQARIAACWPEPDAPRTATAGEHAD